MDINSQAEGDYSRVTWKAFWRRVANFLTGQKNELLPFDEVRNHLPIKGQSYRGLQVVEIDKIVGSFGRYRDFDRAFLPKQKKTKSRWVSIDSAHYAEIPIPPVDLYKIGEAYFVRDGNHRISVARERGQEVIEAYVTEITVPVPIPADIDLSDLPMIEEYATFLEQTQLKELIPDAEIEMTLPGEYGRILEHINTHRWYLGENQNREVPFEEALVSWYYSIYLPLVLVIRSFDLVQEFPERTEADLYLWIVEYQWYRREALRDQLSIEEAARDFIDTSKDWPARRLVKLLRDAAWVDNLILIEEQAAFLERTQLLQSRPEARIELTQPGQYDRLYEHIQTHRWYLGEARKGEIPIDDAAASWYDEVYLPLVDIIRAQRIIEQFPGRTEADLYLWIQDHLDHLREVLGWDVEPESAARDLVEQADDTGDPAGEQPGDGLLETLVPAGLDPGPSPGGWRHERLSSRRGEQLFADLLVPLSADAAGWLAFDQATAIAVREGSRVHGLHVVPEAEDIESPAAQEVSAEFGRRLDEMGLSGELVVEEGDVLMRIRERSPWVDLVVVSLRHPPGESPAARLGSRFRLLIRQCNRPILAVPGAPMGLSRPLLAYDGGRTSDEALYLAASLAKRWRLSLTVVTVGEAEISEKRIQDARAYLNTHQVDASYLQPLGPAAETILEIARERENDLIILGGYGRPPVVELALGSTINKVLQKSSLPVLIGK